MTGASLPVVAVVGAGYAGMTAAGRLAGKAHVIVVNPVDVFVDRIRLHEFIAGTRSEEATAVPIREHLAPQAELVVDTAVRVSPGQVDLASGRRINVDHVIAAVGSGARAGVGTLPGATQIRSSLQRCRPGGRVVVNGAGHTGVEVACEIAAVRPDLHVTLHDPRGLLPDLSTGARTTVARFLARHGAVVRDEPPVDHDDALVIDCTGFAVPDLPGLGVPDQTLMVADGLWAAGDGARTGHRLSCAAAEPMGAHVADNIVRVTNGEPPTVFDLGFVNHALSLGRRRGLVQLTRRDDSPWGPPITGRVAAFGKEVISRMARRVALRSAQAYRWPAGPQN